MQDLTPYFVDGVLERTGNVSHQSLHRPVIPFVSHVGRHATPTDVREKILFCEDLHFVLIDPIRQVNGVQLRESLTLELCRQPARACASYQQQSDDGG